MKNLITYALFLLFSISNLAFAQTPYKVNKITFLDVNSSINPATFNYVSENFKKLSGEKGDLVIIKLDTPGGLVSTTKKIMTLIGSQDFPVGVWITPEGASATSAGAIIASSAHILVMSEGTNIGAATPIQMGQDIEKDARSKAINDLVALVRSLSQARGRNADEFELMISEAKSLESMSAKKKGVIDEIINNQTELIAFLNNNKVSIIGQNHILNLNSDTPAQTIEMDPGQQILNIFSDPSTAYILFIIGAALLYFELQAPGGIIAGALGAIFLVLAGIGFQVLPLNIGALGLMCLAFLLFILEAYITSFGVLTLGGLAALIFGSLFLFRTDNSFIDLEKDVVFSVVAAIGVYVGFVGWFIVKTYKKAKNYYSQDQEEGIISKVLEDDCYQVKVNGEIWNAESDESLQPHDHVKIIKQDNENLKLKVKKITKENS